MLILSLAFNLIWGFHYVSPAFVNPYDLGARQDAGFDSSHKARTPKRGPVTDDPDSVLSSVGKLFQDYFYELKGLNVTAGISRESNGPRNAYACLSGVCYYSDPINDKPLSTRTQDKAFTPLQAEAEAWVSLANEVRIRAIHPF